MSIDEFALAVNNAVIKCEDREVLVKLTDLAMVVDMLNIQDDRIKQLEAKTRLASLDTYV